MTSVTVAVHDRVLLRDRPWIVRKVAQVAGDHLLVGLEALDGDEPHALDVAVPPEELSLLELEEPAFDLAQLDSLTAWANAHRILAATLVRRAEEISGARFARVSLEAYQLVPALRVLSKPCARLLIADDVGLGKTIEAGLVMLELMARGRGRRVLVVVPPGLMEQWRQELLEKFSLEFRIIGNASDLATAQGALPAGVSPWDALPRVITSVDYLKKETVRARALRKRWDLVIVDEAHALAESGTPQNAYRTQRTRLGLELQKASASLLLLTATPHNGYAHAFRSLLELVEPTQATFYGNQEDLRRRVEAAMVRRLKSQIRRRISGQEEPVFPARSVQGIPVRLDKEELGLLKAVSEYCARTAKQAQTTEQAELVGFAMQIIKKRALSSRAALRETLNHRLEALQQSDDFEEPPQPYEIRDLQADLPLTEAQCERTARRIIRSTVPHDAERRASELKTLKNIQKLLKKLPESDPKIEALVRELRSISHEFPDEKVIIFTEYRDTLEAICARLDADSDLHARYAVLHGGLTHRQRLQRQEQFAKPATRYLVATDAASEGLNLQEHCRRVIHVELPWNPNRLEQRNGRVDRYGQRRNPIIRYLYYPDSPEDTVLARLVEKIERMTRDYVSTPDILGIIQGTEAIQQVLTTLDATSPDVEEQKKQLEQLVESRTQDFLGELQPLLSVPQSGMGHEELSNILHTNEPLLADDQALEEVVMAILGSSVKPVAGHDGIYRIEVPWAFRGDEVQPVYEAATFRRSVAAKCRARDMEFITPLHPLVKALAADARRRLLQAYMNARGSPPRRLAARSVPEGEPPSVVFTWLGSVEGGSGLLEEHLIPIRVGLDRQVIGTPEKNFRWLMPDATGNVPRQTLGTYFGPCFTQLLDCSRQAAQDWLAHKADQVRATRQKRAELLRRVLEQDCIDRLKEIDEEERQRKKLVEQSGQQRLFGEQAASGFEARRKAVQTRRQERLEEIDLYAQVRQPQKVRPLGALFLVPQGGAS